MGCANSRERRCRHCQTPLSPVRRSVSLDVRGRFRHSSVDDNCRVMALKSSTLGSMKLDLTPEYHEDDKCTVLDRGLCAVSEDIEPYSQKETESVAENEKQSNGDIEARKKGDIVNEFSLGLIEANTWSDMIVEKISKVAPKTPVRTPPGEPEMINTWELMEGLDDEVSPFRLPNQTRSFSFDVIWNPARAPCDLPKSRFGENGSGSLEPVCSGGIATTFDPEIIASFRRSLQELSPDHPFHIHSSNSQEDVSTDSENREPTETEETDEKPEFLRKEKVIMYFTSLRGVRKTYENCCYVRMILKGIGIRIDERDVSMHSGFKDELAELLGQGASHGGLPRVFLGEKYIGGAEEVQRMHEEGVLEKELEGCQRVDEDGGGETCEACGDVRFVPCKTCSGSCKVYYEEDDEEEEEEECEEGVIGFKRCPDCNENGLIRCPICCY